MEKGKMVTGIYDVQMEIPNRRIIVPRQLREALGSEISLKITGGLVEKLPVLLIQYGPVETLPHLELPYSYKTREGSLEHRVKGGRITIPQQAASFLDSHALSFIGCMDYLLIVRTQDAKALTASPGDDVDITRAMWVE